MPESTSLIEPYVETKARGRPQLKIDTSTRCDPCAFELVESGQESYSLVTIGATLISSGTSLGPKKGRIQKKRSFTLDH